VALTGKKMKDKIYYHQLPAIPAGLRRSVPRNSWAKKPTEVLRIAVKGMLPKNRLGQGDAAKIEDFIPGRITPMKPRSQFSLGI